MPPFHLALPVADLVAARAFYVDLLRCGVGRFDADWIDLDFWGHQVTLHHAVASPASPTHAVDGDAIPVRHFGVILPWADWEALAARLSSAGQPFYLAPRVRFAGLPGEQGTFFIADPSGNMLEFKSFQDPSRIFAV